MTKLIQIIASWLTGELIINLEETSLTQSVLFWSRGMLFEAWGLHHQHHLCSFFQRLNCIVTSAFQEFDSCPWPPLQINTMCPSLLSGLGRMSARQERGDKGKTGKDVFHLLFFWTILLNFASKTLGSGVKRNGPGGTWCVWGGIMKLVTGKQRGSNMRLPLRELAFWVPLAQSLEGRHNRVSPHTSAGSGHSKGVGEQTIRKRCWWVTPAPGSADCFGGRALQGGRLWIRRFQRVGAYTQLCWDLGWAGHAAQVSWSIGESQAAS